MKYFGGPGGYLCDVEEKSEQMIRKHLELRTRTNYGWLQ